MRLCGKTITPDRIRLRVAIVYEKMRNNPSRLDETLTQNPQTFKPAVAVTFSLPWFDLTRFSGNQANLLAAGFSFFFFFGENLSHSFASR